MSDNHNGGVNRRELIALAAQELGITKTEATRVIEKFLDLIQRKLISGDDVRITGLGSFMPVSRGAHEARNPRTGGSVQVGPQVSLRFRPSQQLKSLMN